MLFFLSFVLGASSFSPIKAEKFVLPPHIIPRKTLNLDPSKRKSSYPFITGDTFRSFADHAFDELRDAFDSVDMSHADIVFVNGYFLDYFFQEVHPKIPVSYILITHNSLVFAPGSYKAFLDDAKLIAWFAKNIEIEDHPKLHGIPLGLGNRYWFNGNIDVVKKHMKKKYVKDKLLYLNFSETTHNSRADIAMMFKDKSFCYVPGRKKFDEYLGDLGRSKFVLSPRGAGIDCFRTWEALLVGAIPIVAKTTINSLYDKLPILVVDDWSIITEEYLNKKWIEMCQQSFDCQRMFIDYWINKIKLCQQNARGIIVE